MSWSKNDKELVVELIKSGKTYGEISLLIDKTESSIRGIAFRCGIKTSDFYISKKENIVCIECGAEFEAILSNKRKFCSQACSTKHNNKKRVKKDKKCKYCENEISKENFVIGLVMNLL